MKLRTPILHSIVQLYLIFGAFLFFAPTLGQNGSFPVMSVLTNVELTLFSSGFSQFWTLRASAFQNFVMSIDRMDPVLFQSECLRTCGQISYCKGVALNDSFCIGLSNLGPPTLKSSSTQYLSFIKQPPALIGQICCFP